MKLPDPIIVNRNPNLPAVLEHLPQSRGVYLFALPGLQPHISSSLNLKRRLSRLLVSSYTRTESAQGRYFEQVTEVACWPAGSRLEASLLLYQITRQYYPADYLKRLRLRLPWFVSLLADPFPRLETVNRPSRKHSVSYGPFFSRDLAQRYEQEVTGLFQIRRCVETLVPEPFHPGCIYGEMNQCLRPCQCAVSADEYMSEVERVTDFLDNNGKSAATALSTARERAAAELDFEQAAQIHKRLEKIAIASGARDGVVAQLERFHGVALTKGVQPLEFRLWPMIEGYWQRPITLTVSRVQGPARSLDHELRAALGEGLAQVDRDGNRLEELALFSRWFYSSWRDGHWFPFRKPEDLPYRRLVREISNMSRDADVLP